MPTEDLVVVSFNMENLDDKDSALWARRKEVLVPILERTHAHVLLLQEIGSLSALSDLLQGTAFERYNQVCTETSTGKPYGERNLVILSKWPIEEHKQYKHDLVGAPMWNKITEKPGDKEAEKITWERPILYAKIKLAHGRILHALDLHLKSMSPTRIKGQTDETKSWLWLSHAGWSEGYFLSDVKRLGQAVEARILIDGIFEAEGKDALVVVGGDFNAEGDSTPFKAVVGSVQDTQNADLKPTVLVPCEYNVPPDQRYSLLHFGKGSMLDHIAVSHAFYPYWSGTSIFNEVLPDKSRPFATSDKFPESDHAPVVARFSVPKEWMG